MNESLLIACIGSGNMGGALMKSAAKIAGGKNIGFTDIDRPKAEALAESLGAALYGSNIEAAGNARYIFLAVKPQALPAVLAEIAPVLKKRLAEGRPAVLISMVAGWSIGKIRTGLESPAQGVIRIMPNTPALVSAGMIALCAAQETGAEDIVQVEKLLGAAGTVDRVEEKYLDAVTGLSGSGPAFVYLFIEALADGGVRAGLPRDKALRYAAQTVLGSAAMVLETGRHPGELKDMVTSPGGTTIEGVAALENGAFRGTVLNAVQAAWRRSIELG
ncbi:MAG: pyrroline-5-carboxylate reductase [Treponema sp.]|nr:pyrroline-5-carboxylate reductase [Treponema sp.]